MAEVNAEIQEEVIVDDERSVDGSLPESEDPGMFSPNRNNVDLPDDGSWALRSQKTLPPVPEVFQKPEEPKTPVAVENQDTPKKRAAPPPPISPDRRVEINTIEVRVRSWSLLTLSIFQIEPLEKTLTVSPSPRKKDIASPRKEALDVLDDLNGVLDGEGNDDYFDLMPSSSSSNATNAPAEVRP